VSDWSNPVDPAKDDAFSALFRPESEESEVVVDVEPSGVVEIEVEQPFEDDAPFAASPVVEDVPSVDVIGEGVVVAETRTPSADTGRLFRSARAESDTAIAAVRPEQVSRLRTLAVADAPTVAAAPIAINSLMPPPPIEPEPERRSRRASKQDSPSEETSSRMPALSLGSDMPPLVAYAFVIIVTLIFGLIDAFAFGEGLGFLFGIGLLLSTLIAALRIRVSDAIVPVLAAPIAAFIAALTVGQLGRGNAGDSTTGRAVIFFFTLADNWLWIFGATLLALIIMIVRRRRA